MQTSLLTSLNTLMLSIRARLLAQRLISGLLAVTLLTSCGAGGIANLQQDITLAAQEQLKRSLASHYTREFGNGISSVVKDLAQPGGYLDNPLVRILLPPPLGIALGVARDLQADPQAAVLKSLMNRAAEQVVPGAAPILQKALSQITPSEAYRLLDGGGTAGTDYLKAKTSANLRETLTPQIVEKLAGNGAQDIYGALLATQQTTAADVPADPAALPQLAPSELDEYVTEQTIDGMFKVLGARETSLRENLDAATGGLLPSATKLTPENTAVDTAPAPVQEPVQVPDQDLIQELNQELAREPAPEPPLDPNLIGPVAPSEVITPAVTPTREPDVPSERN